MMDKYPVGRAVTDTDIHRATCPGGLDEAMNVVFVILLCKKITLTCDASVVMLLTEGQTLANICICRNTHGQLARV